MDGSRVLAFAGVALLVIVFPGPSVLFIVNRSLALRRLPVLVTVAGIELGEFAQVCAVALGVGALVAVSDVAFTVVKLVGAAYLVYLGVQTIRHRGHAVPSLAAGTSAVRWRRAFAQAFTVGISNPKVAVFAAAVLPQFADPRLGHVPLQLLVLGLVWTLLCFISDSCWGLAASFVGRRLAASSRRRRRLQWGSGAVMIGLGVGLAVSGRPTTS